MAPDIKSRRDSDDYGDQILTKTIKAGRRTYFLDVRTTRSDDYFLTITESRKVTHSNGSHTFDRHKIYLYKEDFMKFAEGLGEVLEFIRQSKSESFESRPICEEAEVK